jgi:hypothetical protein
VTKYLDNSAFQVGGYTRAYADNWHRIFGKAAEELKAAKEDATVATSDADAVAADAVAVAHPTHAEVTYEKP